jgi:hypothetical protein
VTTPAPLARRREHDKKADLGIKEADVLKKTSASIGLAIAAATTAPLTSSPAYAHANLIRGGHSHHQHRHHSHNRNRNRNQNRNRPRIYIRVYVYNKNNNQAHAVVLRPVRRGDLPERIVRDAGPAIGNLTRDAPNVDQRTTGTAPPTS